jgi:cell surface protein SprA
MKTILLRAAIYLIIAFASFSYGFSMGPDFNLDSGPVVEMVSDTIPIKDRKGDFLNDKNKNPFDLQDPRNVEKEVTYDPVTNRYLITERIGNDYYREPTYMTFSEYMEWKRKEQQREYFNTLAGLRSNQEGRGGNVDPVSRVEIKRNMVDRLFGGTEVSLRPQGNIDLTFGYNYQRIDNPLLTQRQQKFGVPDFDMAIQMNVEGQIGEKLKLSTNYNTAPSFDFDRQIKLQYDSDNFSEDEILKKIEAGNVSLPLRSSLIKGSESLFGIKTELQFGYLRLTALASQSRSQQENLTIQGGGLLQEFELRPDDYDQNRHFFLSHFNRDGYEQALSNLPTVNSVFRLDKIEVWITNDGNQREVDKRFIIALTDLAEDTTNFAGSPALREKYHNPSADRDFFNNLLPSNSTNKIYQTLLEIPAARDLNQTVEGLTGPRAGLKQTRDFEKVRARKLIAGTEYSVNAELGFVSLNIRPRPEQIIAVAYSYSYGGKIYQVGEFASDIPETADDSTTRNVIFTKLLKNSTQNVNHPTWDLMMKNVYPLRTVNLSREDFRLDIFYEGQNGRDLRYLPEMSDFPLVNLFNMDNLNFQGDPQPDGIFDFVPGITVIPQNGSIIFPVLEPFGRSFRNLIEKANDLADLGLNDMAIDQIVDKYSFDDLYNTTVTQAQFNLEKNRFLIRGQYKGESSSEIYLGSFNLSPGSVSVRAGGQILQEGVDYEIDYTSGRLRVLNEQYLNVPINVSYEDRSLFSLQQKTMLGLRADYQLNKNMSIGATYMHLFERPFTRKVNIGDDPINNRIYGLDFNYSNEAPFLTRLVDALPFIDTKAESRITVQAEGAVLRPGHSRAIQQTGSDDAGVVYLDDFEGITTANSFLNAPNQWVLASIPQFGPFGTTLFPESLLSDDFRTGANRANLGWYRVEFGTRNQDDQSNPYTRVIDIQELFPNRTRQPGLNSQLRPLDIYYQPRVRGPYNYDIPGGYPGYTEGINQEGELNAPDTRWAGIMRRIRTVDFEAANYEYIEFWMLNPYMPKADGSPVSQEGKFIIQLGTVSEDIIKDGRQQFENGLPSKNNDLLPTTETNLARVPTVPPQNAAFDFRDINDQDLGLDGFDNDQEREKFNDWLNQIRTFVRPDVAREIENDPSNDDYVHFRDSRFDNSGAGVQERYAKFNNPQGNSQAPEGNQAFSQAYTQIPDAEDLNEDQTLNESENYFHYEIPMPKVSAAGASEIDFDPNDPNSIITETQTVRNPSGQDEKWYRFRVPISSYVDKIGEINDFRSIQFIRLVTTGFDESVTLRMATFGLVRNQWRRYEGSELCQGDVINDAILNIESVNIEENSSRLPFNYVIPNGIQRERIFNTVADVLQNEQSLALIVSGLSDGCAKGIFRFLDRDLRNFKRMKMFVHGESDDNIEPGKMCYFIRIGRDFEQNYYEYEVPLVMSDPSVGPDVESEIWKDENDLDVSLELLTMLKQQRNQAGFPLNQRFEIQDPDAPDRKVTIIGNPDLSIVRGIMIGVKNKEDDGLTHDVEMWINELRLVGLEEGGGVAGLARVDFQLADFGNVTLAANYNSIGWGSIDQRLAQRSLDRVTQLDATVNLQLGKFFPQKSGVSIPFYAQFSNTSSVPKFDAYNRDLLLEDEIAIANDPDSVKGRSSVQTTIKSYNFTNVRKEKTGAGKPMPWDISNFTLSYGYTQTVLEDPILERDEQNQYKGQLEYRYSTQPKYIEPFKKIIKTNLLRFIKDLNFNLIPNSFSFSTNMNRMKAERTYRFASEAFKTWENNRFGWDRNYALKWNLSKSLTFDFNAANTAIVDEALYNPLRKAYIDIQRDVEVPADEASTYLTNSLQEFGRTRDYRHTMNLAYNLPTRSIPIIDWINGRAQYAATYNWAGGSLRTIDSLGSVINNSQNINLSADLNMTRLYDKWSFLKRVSSTPRPSRGGRTPRPSNDRGNPPESPNQRSRGNQNEDINPVVKALVRPLLMVRQVRFSYTTNRSTTIPGFLPQAGLLGMADGFQTPGIEFAAGFQPDLSPGGWLDQSAANNYISSNRWQNNPIIQINSQKFDARATLEPFNEFRIDITMNRDYNETYSEEFRYNFDDQVFEHLAPKEVGSYTISYLALNTLFRDDIYELFNEFEDARPIISQRLANEYALIGGHEKDRNYSEGFGKTNVDVLVPAFLGAYTGISPNDMKLNLFELLPRPNWNITYNGLSKLGFFKNIFSSFTINHGYSSTLRVNSFQTDYDYFSEPAPGDLFPKNDITRSFYSRLDIPAIVINEQFTPLIGVNLKTKNDITINLDFKRSRSLLLSTVAFDLNESKASEYTVGFGYQLKGVRFGKEKKTRDRNDSPFDNNNNSILGGNNRGVSNAGTLNIKFDFSLRDDITVNHQLDVDRNPIPTRGMRSLRLSPSADYALNSNLTLRLFLDYNKTVPYTTNAFPITNFRSGLTVRFTLN